MNVEELKALARCAEPLSAEEVPPARRDWATAYNDLHSRFRERLTRARNSLVLGVPVELELAQELRTMARALPDMRQRVEAG